MYEAPPAKDRIRAKKDDGEFHYVIVEKDERADDGMLMYEKYDDLGYVEDGPISRRKVQMKIPIAKYNELVKNAQELSRARTKLPSVPEVGGRPLEGVTGNTIEIEQPVSAEQFLSQQ